MSGISGYGDIGNGRIFRFAGAVGNDCRIAGPLGHLNRVEGFRQSTDLIDFDEDGVGSAGFDAARQAFGIGDKKVVADDLNLVSEFFSHQFPSVPVILGQAVLDRNDWIFIYQLNVEVHHFGRGFHNAFTFQVIFAVFEYFRSSCIESDANLLARCIACFLDGGDNDLNCFFI